METFDSYVLFLLIVVPLIGAAVIMLTPSRLAQAIRWAATAAASVNLLLSFYIFAAYDYEEGGFQFL